MIFVSVSFQKSIRLDSGGLLLLKTISLGAQESFKYWQTLQDTLFSWNLKKCFKKKLYGPLLWMGFNCLKARATSRRQFTFYH